MMTRRIEIDPWDDIPDDVQAVLLVNRVKGAYHTIGGAHRLHPGDAWSVTGRAERLTNGALQCTCHHLRVTEVFPGAAA